MQQGSLLFVGFMICLFITGCASHPEPIIDTLGVDPVAMQGDWQDCEAYADQVVIGKGAAKGAAGGAAVGAVTGAISGDVEQGVGYGAIWGATRSTLQGSREKQGVFKRCMRGRGYRVLN